MKQPKNKVYTLFVDGASRGNPGAASIGCSVVDENNEEVFSISESIGVRTNNQAEYTAWVRGLEECLKKKITHLIVKSDSELIIRQLQGRYKVKSPELIPLHQTVKSYISQFETFNMTHVPREQNQRADELANEALDAEII